MTYSTELLSESTDGKPIQVTGVDTANAVLIHTAVVTAGDYDQITLFANNHSGSAAVITLEIGGTPDGNLIRRNIPANATKLVLENLQLRAGQTVKAFASIADDINVYGSVGRTVTP